MMIDQQQQDIQTLQAGLNSAEVPDISDSERLAGLSAWGARQLIKEVRPLLKPVPKKELLKKLDVEEAVEVPTAMQQPVKKRVELEKQALDLKNSDLDQYDMSDSWQMNFNTIESEDDVKAIIANMAEINKEQITEARRGIVSDDQLRGLADDLGGDPEFIKKVLQRQHGEMMTPEHILATRQVLERSAIELKKLSMLVTDPETNTDANRLAFGKQYKFHQQFMNEFMGMRAEFGRGLRAFGVPNQGIEHDLIKEQMQYVQSGMSIDKMAEQIATAPTTKGVGEMIKAQDGWIKKSGNIFIESFINSILSGAKTHIINTTGSAMRIGMDIIDTGVAARLGRSLPNNEDKIMLDEWKAGVFGLQSSFMDALAASWQTMKTAEPYGGVQKFETVGQKYISSEYLGLKEGSIPGTVADVLGSVIRFPTERLMGAEDAFFKKLTEGQVVAQIAYRNASRISRERGMSQDESLNLLKSMIENPTEEMYAEATEKSLQATFQKPLGEFGQDVQRLVYSNPFTTYIAPFIKTPTNLLKEAFLERTPLALITKEYKQAVREGGAKGQMAQAKMYVGSTIGAVASMMASNGLITGSDPSDPKEREAKRATGWRPYSFYSNGEYTSYQRLEPYSYIFGAIADYQEVMGRQDEMLMGEEEEKYAERIAASWAVAISNSTLDRTFMTGLRDFLQAASDPKRYMGNYLANQANANIPYSGLRRDISRMMEDNVKLTGSWLDKIKANTPGLNADMPDRLDALGEPVKYDAVLNPWPSKSETNDIIWKEVGRLAESTRKSALTRPQANIYGIKLKPKEYYDMVKLARKNLTLDGLTLRDAIENLITDPEYDKLIDEYKVSQIGKLRQSYDTAAKNIFLENHPDIFDRVVMRKSAGDIRQKAKMTGMSEEDIKDQIRTEIQKGSF